MPTVLSHALADLILGPGDVEQVVDDLKRQAEGLAVTIEGLFLFEVGPGRDGPQPQRRTEQGAGLASMDRSQAIQADPTILGRQIIRLSAHQGGGPRGLRQDSAAARRARRQRSV